MNPLDHPFEVVNVSAEEGIAALPAASVDCIVTSPPYWNLRDYGDNRQLGHEETPEHFINNLFGLFGLALSKLKDTGSIWVNLGDTYIDGEAQMIPQRFANEMRSLYTLKNTIIWYKPDAMAESVQNRFSQKWEPFFWFVKSEDFYFNPDALSIPVTKSFAERLEYKFNTSEEDVSRMRGLVGDASEKIEHYLQRGVNAGDVWIIPKDKDKTGHPAPWPVALAARPIVATCPPDGVVYDPFAGSGQTGIAVHRCGAGRKFIGTDVTPEWAELGNRRIKEERAQMELF